MVCVKLADLHRSCVKLTDSVLKLTNSQISQIWHIYTSVRDSRICEIDFVLKNLRQKSVKKIALFSNDVNRLAFSQPPGSVTYLDILWGGTNPYFRYGFVPATTAATVGRTQQPT